MKRNLTVCKINKTEDGVKYKMKNVVPKYLITALKKMMHTAKMLLRWLLIAVFVGVVVGIFGTLFAYFLGQATIIRTQNPYLIAFLPLAGIVIVFMYSRSKFKNDKGTNLIISTVHARSEVPFKMAPLIFAATILTHLFGGSAGREGAALQFGGSLGNQLGRWLKFDKEEKRVLVMCGMSAAFAAIFGTPIAAALFAIEVVSVGVMYYAALIPCVFSAVIASRFPLLLGITSESYSIEKLDFSILPTLAIMFLALCCAGLSVFFCICLHKGVDLLQKIFKNAYMRIFVSGLLIVLLTWILNTTDYNGTGNDIIAQAIEGNVVPYAFILKIIFTVLTMSSGYKGGEIVPSFFIGATFGCLFGQICGISPSLCAAVGMISLLCGVTNCPITSLLMSFELFGSENALYFIIAIALSYFMSGYYGLYHAQTIVYSKYHMKFLNRQAHK